MWSKSDQQILNVCSCKELGEIWKSTRYRVCIQQIYSSVGQGEKLNTIIIWQYLNNHLCLLEHRVVKVSYFSMDNKCLYLNFICPPKLQINTNINKEEGSQVSCFLSTFIELSITKILLGWSLLWSIETVIL